MRTAVLLIVSVVVGRAQTVWPCEATPPIERELDNPALTDPQVALADRWASFQDLLRRYPEDVFVHRRFQDWLSGNSALTWQERQLASYREAWQKDPAGVRSGYLYARMLLRRDYEKAFAIDNELADKHPDCPWLHLALAEMRASRNMAKLRDPADARRQLDAYLGQCPASLDATGLALIQQVGDTALWEKTATRQRGQLESRHDAAALQAWPQLWQMESRVRPAAEQEPVRQQKRQDLAQLRALNLTGTVEWYGLLRQGYADLGDDEGQKWIDAQLLHDLPRSAAAFDLVSNAWWQAHSAPNGRPAGPDDVRSRELLRASEEWTGRWPNHPGAWQNRMRAVMGLKDTPSATVLETTGKFLDAAGRSPDAIKGTVPPALDAARLLVDRGIGLDRVPELIRQMERQLAANYQVDRQIQYGIWGSPAYRERYRWTTLWEGQRVLFDLYEKTNRKEQALAVVESLRQSVAAVDAGDRLSPAAGWPMVVDMALDADRLDMARAALARLDEPYWEGTARLAVAEGRKLDAISFFLNAGSPAGREQAHQWWTALGGTDAGWQATLDRTASKEGAPAAAIGQPRDKSLPDFVLEDVSGKKVRLADLKGKTLFVNIWATWCAPCREEMPQVEALSRAVKGRGDVAVVTLNADENPGLVKPFLDRSGYSFPVLLGAEYVWKALEVNSIPQNWILDPAGVVRLDLSAVDRSRLAAEVLPLLERHKNEP